MGTYQANLDLCRLAAIAFSKHLWSQPELRDTLKRGRYYASYSTEYKNRIARDVKELLDNFFVPEPVKEELMFVMGEMGTAIIRTWESFDHRYEFWASSDPAIKGSAYVKYISWRTDGSPNGSEIVRSMYFARLITSNWAAWNALTDLCLEDCIKNLWYHMRNVKNYRPWKVGFLADYWNARMENNLQTMSNLLRTSPKTFYDGTFSIEENMFINSVVCAKYAAVQYFWGLLHENQRMRVIAKIGEKIWPDCLNTRKSAWFSPSNYETNHLLIFILHQLSYYGLHEMRIKLLGSGVVLREISYFPYDGVFMDTLRETSTHHDSIDFRPLLSYLFHTLYECKEYLIIDREAKYRRIFYQIWNANLPNLKSCVNYREDLVRLWVMEDIELLNHILRDEEMKDRTEEILKTLAEEVPRDYPDSDFFLNFRSKFLISGQEREWFPEKRMRPPLRRIMDLESDDSS